MIRIVSTKSAGTGPITFTRLVLADGGAVMVSDRRPNDSNGENLLYDPIKERVVRWFGKDYICENSADCDPERDCINCCLVGNHEYSERTCECGKIFCFSCCSGSSDSRYNPFILCPACGHSNDL